MGDKICAVLALLGDHYHDPVILMEALEHLPERDRFEILPHTKPEGFPRQAAERAQILLLARIGRLGPGEPAELWLDESEEQFICDFVDRGGGLLALHGALASYPAGGPLHRLLRGRFVHHPPLHPAVHYTVREPAGEITRRVESFTVEDEQYFVELQTSATNILMVSRTPEHGQSPAGWAHRFGRGRVCVLAPGHTASALLHPMMQRLLGNALAWCLPAG
jgi:type 1 glutamine amidotransferase